jgi:hypothetical protein
MKIGKESRSNLNNALETLIVLDQNKSGMELNAMRVGAAL